MVKETEEIATTTEEYIDDLKNHPDIISVAYAQPDVIYEIVGILPENHTYVYCMDELLGKEVNLAPEMGNMVFSPRDSFPEGSLVSVALQGSGGYFNFGYGGVYLRDVSKSENESVEIMEKGTVKTTTTKRVVNTSKVKVSTTRSRTNPNFLTLNKYFKVSKPIYNVLKRNIEKGTNTLLLGPTGVGKTEMVSNIAKDMGIPLTIFDMGTMSDPIMSLVGSHVIKVHEGKTSSEFKKSRFSEVIQKPGIILLDEISRSPAQANNILFPCLDFRKELPMEYCFEDTESIKIHPECIFVATANLGSQYTGTHKLDRALLDRFMLIEIDPLEKSQIIEAIKYHTPKLTNTEINKIVTCYEAINKAHDDYTISFNLSLRHLKMIAELVGDGFTIYDSFYVICKGIGSKEGLKSLEQILNTTK